MLGDGRLSFKKAQDHNFDFIILDAFSSDSIPVHLITKQALKLYLDKLAPNGILAFHISNRYLDLKSVLGDLALDAGVFSIIQNDSKISKEEERLGKEPSIWILMARRKEDFKVLNNDNRWKLLLGENKRKIWTDDFSNIFSILTRPKYQLSHK